MAALKLGFIPTEGGHFYREALEEVERAVMRELTLLAREVLPAFR